MVNSQGGKLGRMNPAIERHLELQIKTLLQMRLEEMSGQVGTAFESKIQIVKTRETIGISLAWTLLEIR